MKNEQTPETADTYHHGALREALLQSALAMLDEEASVVGALSLRAVARRAGVTPMATYRHYPDKEALLAAVAVRGFERLRESGLQADAAAPPGQALIAQAVNFVQFALAHPGLFRLMFGPPPAVKPPGLREAEAASIAVLTDRIALDRPGLPDPQAWTLAAWSAVHGLTFLILDGRLEDEWSLGTVEEAVARVAAAILSTSAAL